MKGASEDELIAHAQAVAREIPLVGFYLQPAVGGIVLPTSFWRRFAAIDNVVAIKIAPFNRYRTLDVVRGVVEAGAVDRVTLYTGNDDHIVPDLVTPYAIAHKGAVVSVRIRGGLLGHWSVWVRKAVELLDQAHLAAGSRRGAGRSPGARLAGDGLQCRDLRRRQQFSRRHRRLPRNPPPAGPAGGHLVPRSRRSRSDPARRRRSIASAPPIHISTTTPSCGRTWSAGWHDAASVNWPLRRGCRTVTANRKPREAVGENREMLQRYALAVVSHLLLVAGVVPLRRARARAEVRAAVAFRHSPGAARSELPLDREQAGHRQPRSSAATFLPSSSASAPRCCSRGRERSKCSSCRSWSAST